MTSIAEVQNRSEVQSRSSGRLRWSPVEIGPGAGSVRDLKFILREREFRSLCAGDAPCGYYRGLDGRGNAVMVRVIADEVGC